MFRAAYRSPSGALTVFAVNQRLQIQLELLMMSSMPLETCCAFNKRWNNKFYYKVASCWLFLLSHTTMHGSVNIKHRFISDASQGQAYFRQSLQPGVRIRNYENVLL